MDFVNHALAGAAVGQCYGAPITGAFIGMLLDVPLIGKRVAFPPEAYYITHSFAMVLATSALGWIVQDGLYAEMVFFCLLSHLLLDVTTHSEAWGAKLFYPLNYRFGYGYEWEWFNRAWFLGLTINILWCTIWLSLDSPPYLIGYLYTLDALSITFPTSFTSI